MEKEFIRQESRSVTLNVTGGKIDSFRELEKTTGTVRVYDNGCIGVAGCLGEPDEAKLTEKAKEALAFAIPYPCALEGPAEIEELHEEEILAVPDFIPVMQAFLDRLGELCPKFALSNKISLNYERTEYRNSLGRHLVSSGNSLLIELVAQSRGSGNLFDTGFFWVGDRFDPERLLERFKEEYDAFYTPAELPDGRWPVVGDASAILGTFFPHFTGDMIAAGASLLTGKMGERVFADTLSLRDDRNGDTAYGACFFDAEGCTAPDYRPVLVENGVLKAVLTTKKTARQYGLPVLGTADAAYDGVPELGLNNMWLDPTAGSLEELVPGKAVYVVMASGGDATPEGHFASPVQMAYLLEGGKLVGRLPDISISGDFFTLFGEDYLGTVRDEPFPGAQLSALMMDVTNG